MLDQFEKENKLEFIMSSCSPYKGYEFPLMTAVRSGDTNIVAQLLARSSRHVNQMDSHGRTPLFCAAQSENPEMITLLLQHGANPNLARVVSCSWLIEGAKFTGSDKIIERARQFIASTEVNNGKLLLLPRDIAFILGHSEVLTTLSSVTQGKNYSSQLKTEISEIKSHNEMPLSSEHKHRPTK